MNNTAVNYNGNNNNGNNNNNLNNWKYANKIPTWLCQKYNTNNKTTTTTTT